MMDWIPLPVLIMIAASLRVTPPPAAGHKCAGNYCSTVTCVKVSASECDGKVEANASDCGCCDGCVKQLDEGDICFSFRKHGMRKWGECGDGLVCNEAVFRCERKRRLPFDQDWRR
ncbi:hypothetical protein HPB50_011851 [Hyalomma asiaticum]|uniref:Uncharacterized protein n=1 Tax=Hyalomma asiaticum TaxID=266040 RepID=A0ACB7T2A3_HYAAI|nr:hypothetical protein HPB50_011851 [Hyalomma asiaticum]